MNTGPRIGLLLSQESRGILIITDLLGRTNKIYDQVWLKGYNEVILHRNELKETGVYYYSFESENFKAMRKMILIEELNCPIVESLNCSSPYSLTGGEQIELENCEIVKLLNCRSPYSLTGGTD